MFLKLPVTRQNLPSHTERAEWANLYLSILCDSKDNLYFYSRGDVIDEQNLDDSDACDKCCDYTSDKNEHREL